MKQSYALSRINNLLLSRAAIGGDNDEVGRVRLLVDTGASYTMLPVEAIEALGYDISHPIRTVRMVAANGIVVAPVIKLTWFHCLGKRVEDFPIVVHTIPSGTMADGLLGMDFLIKCRAMISTGEAKIYFQEP